MSYGGNGQFDSDQERLLAYIEGEASAEEAAQIEARLASNPARLATLRTMREDRSILRSLDDVTAPEGLIDDAIAVAERSMLLDDAPLAPEVPWRRRRATVWRQVAVAAAVVLLVGGAVGFLAQNLWLNAGADDWIALDNANDEVESPLGTGSESPTELLDDPVLRDDLPTSERVAEEHGAVANEPSLVASAESANEVGEDDRGTDPTPVAPVSVAVITEPPPAHSVDLGLTLRVTADDLAETLRHANDLACASGGAVVWNLVEVSPTSLADSSVEIGWATTNANGFEPSLDAVGRRRPNRQSSMPSDDLIIGPNRWLPFDEQSQWGRQGFQITLVGTPSHLRELLRSLDRSGAQLQWGAGSDARLLAPRPSRPSLDVAELSRVVHWWRNPTADFELASRLADALRPEPIVRIPVRLRERRPG
ncbi:MAG: hypothetical protein ACF8PN_14905 [Phycisphaerales bacterium]